jgi:hypothetical protein
MQADESFEIPSRTSQRLKVVFRDSVVRIATSCGMDVRGVRVQVAVGPRILSSSRRSDRLWGPPSLLSKE